jgi:tetraacyldisaccharide 4'-kinase
MRPPAFWQRDGVLPRLLAPLASITAAVTARRMARPGWRAPVPVICCGNATVGGAGKTTLALDLGARFSARGVAVAFLTRGYGGRVSGTRQVARADSAALVGDEALLLADIAPTFVGPDRKAAAAAAIAAGARLLIMDDGLQNPSLAKSFSFLVVDGISGFGNGRVLPAGPLREPVGAAAARCRAAVLIGQDRSGASASLPPDMTVLRADLHATADLSGQRVLAFAGIGRPEKFFDSLRAAGAELAACRRFPDHHAFRDQEIQVLLDEAARLGVSAVTTPKDAVRLEAGVRDKVGVVGVRLVWRDEAALGRLLGEVWP